MLKFRIFAVLAILTLASLPVLTGCSDDDGDDPILPTTVDILALAEEIGVDSATAQDLWSNISISLDDPNVATLTSDLENQMKAVACIRSLETQDTAAFLAYAGEDNYIQHNLSFPDGRATVIGAMEAGQLAGTTVTIHRVFSDDDMVFLHNEYMFLGEHEAAFDVFRFENGLIVEHWDNLQLWAEPNPSGRTMVDGPRFADPNADTEACRAVVQGFVNDVLIGGDFDGINAYFDGDNYIQHNPNIADTLTALFQALGGGGPAMVFQTNHQLLASGDFVLSMTEGMLGETPTAFYDMFRVENGVIAEHWDVIQTIPPQDEWLNENGKF